MFPSDTSGELDRRKEQALDKLLSLSDDLFTLRKGIVLSETDPEETAALGKRKRPEEGLEDYLISATNDSAELVHA